MLFVVTLLVSRAAAANRPSPPETCPGTLVGSIDGFSPTLLGRHARNGTASTCAVPKVPTVELSSGDRGYALHPYQNDEDTSRCASFTLTETSSGGGVMLAAYPAFMFNPSSILDEALADGGRSSEGAPVTFTMTIPARSRIDVIVYTVQAGASSTYSLTASDCGTIPLAILPSNPTVDPLGVISFTTIGGFGPSVATAVQRPARIWTCLLYTSRCV